MEPEDSKTYIEAGDSWSKERDKLSSMEDRTQKLFQNHNKKTEDKILELLPEDFKASDLEWEVRNEGTKTLFYRDEPIITFYPTTFKEIEEDESVTIKVEQAYEVHTEPRAQKE